MIVLSSDRMRITNVENWQNITLSSVAGYTWTVNLDDNNARPLGRYANRELAEDALRCLFFAFDRGQNACKMPEGLEP